MRPQPAVVQEKGHVASIPVRLGNELMPKGHMMLHHERLILPNGRLYVCRKVVP